MIQNAESYQDLLDRLCPLETLAAIREGIASAERGELQPAEQVLAEMQAKQGLQGSPHPPSRSGCLRGFRGLREVPPSSAARWLIGLFVTMRMLADMPARCPVIPEAEELGPPRPAGRPWLVQNPLKRRPSLALALPLGLVLREHL